MATFEEGTTEGGDIEGGTRRRHMLKYRSEETEVGGIDQRTAEETAIEDEAAARR